MKMGEVKYFPAESAQFAAALESLKGQKIAVLGHQRPDGDCIGSMVAMVRLLQSLGFESIGLNRDAVPTTLQPFVGDTPLMLAEEFESQDHLAIAVDCADFKRVGDRLNQVFPEVTLNIDHHLSNKGYAAENIVISTASATAEILAAVFLDQGYPIDSVMAQALYVGIATDTGQFRFTSTTPKTFEIARQLCEYGARPAQAAYHLYECESFAKVKLLQSFLNSLKQECAGRVCVGLIEDGVYENTGATIDDSEGLVDYARAIEGVDIGVLIENRGGALKGSLRAKNPFYRVDLVAKQFNGGGHACAAGLNVEQSSIEVFYPQLLHALEQHLTALGSPE
jgi:bifunctional oligoribonuclease and PAP phosphatase NrnA